MGGTTTTRPLPPNGDGRGKGQGLGKRISCIWWQRFCVS